jgi:hypothetical protein
MRRPGSIIPVAGGRMRNQWFPNHLAEYVTPAQLKELGEDAVIERDSTFGINVPMQIQQESAIEEESHLPIHVDLDLFSVRRPRPGKKKLQYLTLSSRHAHQRSSRRYCLPTSISSDPLSLPLRNQLDTRPRYPHHHTSLRRRRRPQRTQSQRYQKEMAYMAPYRQQMLWQT